MKTNTQIVIRVDKQLKEQIKKIATKKRTSISSIIKQYLVQLVEKEKRKI